MSDSDSDLLPSNVYSFQNGRTEICAKGPNVNSTNLTGSSFRNTVLSSTMNMPMNFQRQRYPELSFDQRSMPFRRENSPMSIHSDTRIRNYHHSFYPGGMSSHRSMYNGRSGSPMSMQSMDSNVTMSAADIALALKKVNFNKCDKRILKEAFNKFMYSSFKKRVRKRIEKRRNMRLFLKDYRKKSGYDSGEQESDSSTSSDDCRSTHSAMYQENFSSCRSTRTDIPDLRGSIVRESNMYKDCTNSLRKSAFINTYSVPPSSTSMNHRSQDHSITQNLASLNQKSRFQNGFLLPSQRFNQSVTSVSIPEGKSVQSKCFNKKETKAVTESDSDQEQIFSEKIYHIPLPQLSKVSVHKRGLEELEDNEYSHKKRRKLSPIKDNYLEENNNKEISNQKDFEFLKPQFPVRKLGASKFKDKVISKSAPPLFDAFVSAPTVVPKNQNQQEPSIISSQTDKNSDEAEAMPLSTTDLSMRPSFIKRKLFSQKMDVTESRTLSTEALNINSPQTDVYCSIQREKHRARKVVTNQSCLNRDIGQEDNNLLDLIHKIVPPDRMNVTNVTNKTSLGNKLPQEGVKNDDDDKWDVTSVISMCNNDDVSDTYTDEEIFNNNKQNKKSNKEKSTKEVNMCSKVEKKNSKIQDELKDYPKVVKEYPKAENGCKIVLERILDIQKVSNCQSSKPVAPKNDIDNNKRSVQSYVKSFWDTDLESDLESPAPKRWVNSKENENKSEHCLQQRNKDKPQKNSPDTSDMQNTTSLSESLKCETNNLLLENTLRKPKKYNINRNLTIKAFRTPKIKITDKTNDITDTIPPGEDKPTLNKTKQQDLNLKTKFTKKENKTSEVKKTRSNVPKEPKKITPTTTSKSNIGKNSTQKQIDNKSQKLPEPQNEKTDNLGKSKIAVSSDKVESDMTSVKPKREYKKKICCNENNTTEKQNKNSKINTYKVKNNKSTKLDNSKPLKKLIKTPSRRLSKTKQLQENKENVLFEPMESYDIEPMNRTLRSRKIDLASSTNTSTECVNNITFRSLRNRRIDLSSSNNDSTLVGNLTELPRRSKRSFQK